MKHNYFFSTLLMLLLFAVPATWAVDILVDGDEEITSSSSSPKLRFETNAMGDVIITMLDGTNATNAHFRGLNPFYCGVNKFYLQNSTNSSQYEARLYFTVEHVHESNAYIFRRNTTPYPYDNPRLVFLDHYIQWSCDEQAEAVSTNKYTIRYPIGQCYGGLATPTNVSVSSPAGSVTFDAVANATSYKARVYLDRVLVHEQSITSGGTLTFAPFVAASTTYKVTVQAIGSDQYSAESATVDWITTGNTANLPMSNICNYLIHDVGDNAGNVSSIAYITIETDKTDGSFTIRMTSPDNAYFRSGSYVSESGLKIGGEALTNYFQRSLLDKDAGDRPKTLKYTLKAGQSVPYGKIITFQRYSEDQPQIEYYVGGVGKNTPRISFSYIYGTDCTEPAEPAEPEPEHSQPTGVSVNGSKVISFTAVPVEEEVDSYNAVVKLSGVTVKTVENIVSGTTAIAYASTSASTYQVYVQAIKGGELYSTSEAFDWALPKEMSAPSEYCDYEISDGANPAHKILLTWETNHVGDVIIRLADGENTTNAVFRGSEGMGQLSWYQVKSNGGATSESASTYFNSEYAGDGATMFALRRKANVVLPADAVINYENRPVQWKSDGVTNPAHAVTLNYTYGSSCATLPLPVITSVSEAGVITFPAVIGASSYTARVYDGQTLLYTQENITSGDVINFGAYYSATFQVTLQAFGNAGTYSDESAGTNWALTGDLNNLPESNVCNYLLRQGSEASSEVFISIETDDSDGSFYITMRPDNAAFRDNEYIVQDGLKYEGQALTSYFTRSFLDEIATNKPRTIKYTPIDRNNVQYGKNITFNKYSEGRQLAWWTNTSSSHNSNQLSYGTKCSLDAAFEHSSNVSLYADHAGENLTVDAAMTINGNGHEIGDITVTNAGALTVGSALTANKLLVNAKPGASGQVIGAANLTVSEAWMSQQLLPDADELNPATDWYCFTVPFAVSLTAGIFTNEGVKLNSGSDYLIWRYDGDQRASTGKGWVKATENLSAGVAYLIGFKNSETAKIFRFKKADGALAEPTAITIAAHASGNAADANWNAVGNPGLRHINVSDNKTVQVLNNASQTFAPYQTDEQSFVVGSPFFVQATDNLSLEAASHPLLAPARTPAQRMQACVELYEEGRSWPDDRLYVAADETASDTWEQGSDVPTLNTTSNRVALMHTLHYGMKLAAVELPWAEQVDYALTITAPADGTYTLHAASQTDNAVLYLTHNGCIIWNMSAGDCALTLAKGTDNSYGLRLVQAAPQVATDVANTSVDSRHSKIMNNGQLYILRDGHWYNAIGQSVSK